MFLWIAIEVLAAGDDALPRQPSRHHCGHLLGDCPRCGKLITAEARGDGLRKYLQTQGISEDDARAMWKMPQIMHGNAEPGSPRLEPLPHLTLRLRAFLTSELKKRVGIEERKRPHVRSEGMFTSGMRAVMSYEVTPESLAELHPEPG